MRFVRIAPVWAVSLAIAASATHGMAAAGTNAPAAGAAARVADLFPDPVVARGKGFEIKRSQLDELADNAKASYASQGVALAPADRLDIERRVLEQMIQLRLLLTQATDADRTQGKAIFDKAVETIKTNATALDDFKRRLTVQGLTWDKWEKDQVDQATAGAFLEREFKISVTDADVKKFYDDNPAKFEQPEMVRVGHILFSTRDPATGAELGAGAKQEKRKKAEEILKRARAGEDFAKLALENSDDAASKTRGGEITFARASADPQHAAPPEVEAAAFALGTNQISDVVTSAYGYDIIKLWEKIPARKIELARVSDDIRNYLKGQAIQKQLPDYIAKLRKDANVEILDDGLKLPASEAAVSAPK